MNPNFNTFFSSLLLVFFSIQFQPLQAQSHILLYTETSGYNHGTEQVTQTLLDSLGIEHSFVVDLDNTGDSFSLYDSLIKYDIVIWANTSGANLMDSTQRSNFERYMAAGGNMMGIHAASDTYRHGTANGSATGKWDWYAETLGASVQSNPNHTANRHLNFMDHQISSIALDSLPNPWEHADEYYYWENGYFDSLNNHVLLKVRETDRSGAVNSYDSARAVSWIRDNIGGGKAFYTALGHHKSSYEQDSYFKIHIRDAILTLLAPPPVALNINWNKVDIKQVSMGNLISWETQLNDQGGYFLVERREDIGTWKEISQQAQATNSSRISTYAFLDPVSSEKKLYYRIGYKAINGNVSYSKILSLNTREASVQVLGNPFSQTITLQFAIPQRGDFQLEILDIRGKSLIEHRFYHETEKQELTFNTAYFPPGIYFLKVSSKDFNFAQRILKQ